MAELQGYDQGSLLSAERLETDGFLMPVAKLGEIDIAYEVHGDDTGNDIVLLRGLGTQLIEWPATLLDGLVEGGLRAWTPDNRDAGLSTKLDNAPGYPPYRLEDMARDVIGLLDHVAVKQAHVLGISMGGAIAQHVAFGFPERVASLISVMSGSGNPDLPPMAPAQRELLTRVAADIEEAIVFDTEEREIWGSPGYPVSHSDRLAASRRAAQRCYAPEGSARQLQAVIADGSRVDRLRALGVPTLVIHGADDSLVPPAAGIDTAACVPDAQLELIPGMGHNIPPVLGPLLARHINRFVSQLPR
jgi:proline iminopeptidase